MEKWRRWIRKKMEVRTEIKGNREDNEGKIQERKRKMVKLAAN